MKKIVVEGTIYECGVQLGQACKSEIQDLISITKNSIENGDTTGNKWADFVKTALLFLEPTRKNFPNRVLEIEGVSKGAGIPFEELWGCLTEEAYGSNFNAKCSDLVFDKELTGNSIILGHNNDTDEAFEPLIRFVEWHIKDWGTLYTIGPAGVYMSVGFNEFGLVLSGNTLSPNDVKLGVPRFFIAKEALETKTLEYAREVILSPERASSYNNIIVFENECVDFEASGTDAREIYPNSGYLIHTNHYLHEDMKKYEGSEVTEIKYTESIGRYEDLLKISSGLQKPATVSDMKKALRSHGSEKSGSSVCRHGDYAKTVFSWVVDFNLGVIECLNGNPCESEYEEIYRW